jgi:hypothetical protein
MRKLIVYVFRPPRIALISYKSGQRKKNPSRCIFQNYIRQTVGTIYAMNENIRHSRLSVNIILTARLVC